MAAKIKKGLGRGLGALLQDEVLPKAGVQADTATGSATIVSVADISKGTMQPRRNFNEETLSGLSESIKEHGIIQPLIVRRSGKGYELIAGERRLRAAGEAGLTTVPVIVVEAGDGEAMELALVENLQRDDLNILEEAEGYQVLAERFNLTQEQIAERIGKARASVSNAMRLLALPSEIKGLIASGELSAGHAKVITGVDIEQEQILFARRAVKENLSVRNLEKIINRSKRGSKKPRASREDIPRDHIAYLSDRLHAHFGTSIRITACRTFANGKKGKGTVEIDYFSNDDLDRVLTLMGIDGD